MSDDNKKSDSIWNKDIGELKQDALDKLFQLSAYIQNAERLPLEEFINQRSESLDQFILEVEKRENVAFIGGIFSIESQSIRLMKISFDFYFKHKITSEFVNKKGTEENLEMDLYLDDQSIEQLIRDKKVDFNIDPPTK